MRKEKQNFTDICEAWKFLTTTDVFWHKDLERGRSDIWRDDEGVLYYNAFCETLNIEMVKVNPETNSIDDDKSLNTKTQFWLESGEPYTYADEGIILTPDDDFEEVRFNSHNPAYDSGGDTFEEAIIDMANRVAHHQKIKKEFGGLAHLVARE